MNMQGYEIVHWLAAKMSEPTEELNLTFWPAKPSRIVSMDGNGFSLSYRHDDQCPWHLDQYDWECTCGLVAPTVRGTVTVGPTIQLDPLSIMDFGCWPNFPTRSGSIPNPYSRISTDPIPHEDDEVKPLTEAQKAVGRAVKVSWGNR